MKKLRSLLALFFAGFFTTLMLANSVSAINAPNLLKENNSQSNSQKIIAFGRSNARQQYLQQLEVADKFYQQGAISKALEISKQVKASFTNTGTGRRQPIDDPAQLSGGASSYYRNGKSGLDEGLITKALIPLQRLSEDYPEFIPGHIMLAQAARKFSDNDAKIVLKRSKLEVELEALESGSSMFPERKDLLDERIKAFATYDKFIEASITARQFSTLFPDDPDSGKYLALAESYLQKHRASIADRILSLSLAGTIFGGDIQQIQAILSLTESEFGAQGAEREKANRSIVTDPEINSYVNNIGQKIAKTMGRNEFNYEFYIYKDDNDLNAFAYPGGKIFIASGLLNSMGTEAELAGLLGHEVGHAVLSHGYIKIIERIAAKAVGGLFGIDFILQGNLAENSRTAEKQSDILGTRALAASGYSADGVWNVMRIFKSIEGGNARNYLSTHPPASDRVAYVEDFITRNSFNRFGYEGVANYRSMQARLGGDSTVAIANDKPNNSAASAASTNSTPLWGSTTTDHPTASPRNREQDRENNTPVAAVSGCTKGKVPLTARLQRDQVTVSLDGAFVATSCSSFTANVKIQNDSDRSFTFVPGFIQVFDTNDVRRKARLTMKKGQTTSVEPGQIVEANLQVFDHHWNGNGKQDLTFEIKEGSSVARVFRLAF